MKIFNRILKVGLLILVASCQPDEIKINTGPLFPGQFSVSGTNNSNGEAVVKAVNENETGVPINSVFTVGFSKAVDPATVAVTLTQDGTPVDVSVNVEGESITVDPTADLQFGTRYTLAVDKSIKAADGGVLLDALSRSFTTESQVPTIYEGQIFYMPFDGDYKESVSGTDATVVGTPGFAGEGIVGDAYAGAADSYLTFPAGGLHSNAISASFWLKVDAVPDRAGVLVIGPPDPNLPATPNNRTAGFRFFREDASGKQRFKLNVGDGTADSWFDGGAAADVDPAGNKWVHFAFTISETEAAVYINGEVVSQGSFSGISWEGCDILSIMSGAPRFTEWGHLSDESYMDELRIFNKALTQEDVKAIMSADRYNGQTLYMPFDGSYKDVVSSADATVVGTPGFAGEAVIGDDSYEGAADSYLTFPAAGLQGDEFSATFWLKVNAAPDRAGVLVMGPPDPNLPATPNNRTAGFRFFREDASGMQRYKLNIGTGTSDSWFDGGAAADVDPTTNEWVHFAFTISQTEAVVYINGEVVSQGPLDGVSWEGCDILSIMSGAPRFMEWGHLSDLSFMDELHLFNRALTQGQVQAIMEDR
jgi:hypothetical protein